MIKILLVSIIALTSVFANSELEKKIGNIVKTIPNSTKASIYILDANTGKSIFKKNSGLSMIPASNTKLFTTAAALNLMGATHEFSTKILIDSMDLDKGLVNGNLYIKGFGHSTFTTDELDSLVEVLKSVGVKIISGNIVADDSYFDDLYIRDDWIIDERANVRLPPVSALVINRNQFVITLKSRGKIGSKLGYSIKPDCSFIEVDMNANVTRNNSRPRIKSSQKGERIKVTVSGGLRQRKSTRSYVINIGNPPLYFASILKERLQKVGINVLGKTETGITPPASRELASVGIGLDSLIALINKFSNNYLAECLFKALGAYYSNDQGNSFYATQAVLSSFEGEDIIDDETAVVDGSGISRFNTITSGSIVRLLHRIYNDKNLYENFYRSLAISGVDGTLKNRPLNTFIKGNFHGKTGTLNGVTALSGYVTNRQNHTYIVSIIMEYKSKGSGFHKDIEDKILIELTK